MEFAVLVSSSISTNSAPTYKKIIRCREQTYAHQGGKEGGGMGGGGGG